MNTDVVDAKTSRNTATLSGDTYTHVDTSNSTAPRFSRLSVGSGLFAPYTTMKRITSRIVSDTSSTGINFSEMSVIDVAGSPLDDLYILVKE